VELAGLVVVAFLAGWVDAVIGGGGLLQVPALFAVYPAQAPATLFGTNKLSSIAGTGIACARYFRAVRLPLRVLVPAFATALLGSYTGAAAVAAFSAQALRPAILALLVLVAAYTFFHRDFGLIHAPRLRTAIEPWAAGAVGGMLGFYDGFFGPGTGTFLVFIFIRLFGYDFLSASAAAKLVNFGTNLAALSYFAPTGHIFWATGLAMAVANMAGSAIGTQVAIARGSAFVRKAFLVLVLGMIAKFGYDTLR
jgi:uncharacterized membrane protein YfcA